MRAAIALAGLLVACTDAPAVDDEEAGGADGKEDTAGSRLCDPLPAASRDLCSQIPNNGWRTALKAELVQPYFEPLAQRLAAARAADDASTALADNVYPARDNTFAALRRLSPGRVKVVIVGQDPYFNEGQANGLSFSVSPGVAVPPSLRNIFVELAREAGDPELGPELPAGFACPATGDLGPWASHGVLLLNAILTVRDGVPGSHKDFGWQSLTDAILRVVRDRNRAQGTAFLLWGAFAQSKEPLISGREAGLAPNPKVAILEAPHPSPAAQGYAGNNHFALANRFLVEQGRTPVDWSLPLPAAGETPAHCR